MQLKRHGNAAVLKAFNCFHGILLSFSVGGLLDLLTGRDYLPIFNLLNDHADLTSCLAHWGKNDGEEVLVFSLSHLIQVHDSIHYTTLGRRTKN